jgi:Fungal specific transcription factor domain
MHALLCLSATHLMHTNPDSHTYDDAIVFHKHFALSLLRSELSSVTQPSQFNDSIYGSTLLLAFQAVATYNMHPSFPTDLDWIPLVSGFKTVLTPMRESVSDSIFHPLIKCYRSPEKKTPAEELQILERFNLCNLSTTLPPSYSETIAALALLLDLLFPDETYSAPPLSLVGTPATNVNPILMLRRLFAWTTSFPGSFVSRAKEGDPAILTILEWTFCMFRKIYSSHPLWWLERISTQGVEDMARLRKEIQIDQGARS